MAKNVESNGGVTGAGWKPGQSGNPGGRPKGLAAAVREVAPPEKLAQFYLAVFLHGTDAALMDDELRAIIGGGKVTFADRLKAAEWLTDRGYGKAPVHAPIEGENPLELDSIARRIATVVDELAARREADASSEAARGQLAGTG